MRRISVILSLIGTFAIIIGLLFVSSAGSSASDAVEPNSGVEVEAPANVSDVDMQQSTTQDAPVTVAQLPPPTPQDNACVDCHSDAERLQLVAEEEVVTASLNEGSG